MTKALTRSQAAQIAALVETFTPRQARVVVSEFGAALASARDAKGMTQDRLAKIVGCAPAYICQIEMGARRFPSSGVIRRACVALGLDADKWIVIVAIASNPDLQAALKSPAGRAALQERA